MACKDANLAQDFLNADIPALLNDLPNLILAEKKHERTQTLRFRISAKDKAQIEKQALDKGYSSVSSFLRDLALNTQNT